MKSSPTLRWSFIFSGWFAGVLVLRVYGTFAAGLLIQPFFRESLLYLKRNRLFDMKV